MRQAETQLGSSRRALGGGSSCFGMALASTTLSRRDETGAAAVLPCPALSCHRFMPWMMTDRPSLLLILLCTWQDTPWRRRVCTCRGGVRCQLAMGREHPMSSISCPCAYSWLPATGAAASSESLSARESDAVFSGWLPVWLPFRCRTGLP